VLSVFAGLCSHERGEVAARPRIDTDRPTAGRVAFVARKAAYRGSAWPNMMGSARTEPQVGQRVALH